MNKLPELVRETVLVDYCECGSRLFRTIESVEVFYKLEGGRLERTESQSIGNDEAYECSQCGKEYQAKNFTGIETPKAICEQCQKNPAIEREHLCAKCIGV
jgi:hypothetical protein